MGAPDDKSATPSASGTPTMEQLMAMMVTMMRDREEKPATQVTQLPASQKLKGQENFRSWMNDIKAIAQLTGALEILTTAPEIDQKETSEWKKRNSYMMTAIMLNVQPDMKVICENKDTAKEMWDALIHHCEGSGITIYASLLAKFIGMKVTNYDSVHEYVTDFKHTLDRLNQVLDEGDVLPRYMAAIIFTDGLAPKYPIWADRQRGQMRAASAIQERPQLEALMADIEDEARRRPLKGNNKNISDSKALMTRSTSSGACGACGDPRPKHPQDKCFAKKENKKAKEDWEKKTGKKYLA